MEKSDDARQGDFDSSRKAALSKYTNSSSSEQVQKLHIPAAMDRGGRDDSEIKIIAVNSADDDGFVALDIARLVAAKTTDQSLPAADPGTPVVMKSLSRKLLGGGGGGGPHRGGGEAVCLPAVGGTNGRDVPPLLGKVALEGEAASVAGGRGRRASAGRRPSPWRDPRRVLFVFASLSCIGTLILLYLALSMGRMTSNVDGDS